MFSFSRMIPSHIQGEGSDTGRFYCTLVRRTSRIHRRRRRRLVESTWQTNPSGHLSFRWYDSRRDPRCTENRTASAATDDAVEKRFSSPPPVLARGRRLKTGRNEARSRRVPPTHAIASAFRARSLNRVALPTPSAVRNNNSDNVYCTPRIVVVIESEKTVTDRGKPTAATRNDRFRVSPRARTNRSRPTITDDGIIIWKYNTRGDGNNSPKTRRAAPTTGGGGGVQRF